jgi:hypothetical protein
MRATIWRDAHNPHARSGGSTALIFRRVSPLTAAAPRDRIDPRAGIVSVVTTEVQHQLVTFVNVNIRPCEGQLISAIEKISRESDDATRERGVARFTGNQRGGSPRQLKLLTYFPMSRASCRPAADGLPEPKSGPNAWYGPTAPAISARSFFTATITTSRIRV